MRFSVTVQALTTPTQMLIQQAHDHPDAVAFSSGTDLWTFRRLAEAAMRLAWGL